MKSDVERYFQCLASLCEDSFAICEALDSAGMGLAQAFWSRCSVESNQFTIELIKEENASYVDGSVRLGYRSDLVSSVLQETGLSLKDLHDLSRSPEVDRKIANDHRLEHYTREAALIERSSERVNEVRAIKTRELENIGYNKILNLIKFPVAGGYSSISERDVVRVFAEMFGEYGLKIKKSKSKDFDFIFFCDKIVGNVGFYLRLESAFGFQPPFFCNLYIKPLIDYNIGDEHTPKIIASGNLACSLRVLIRNFGLYSTTMDSDGLLLCLYGYAIVIPFIIKHFSVQRALTGC